MTYAVLGAERPILADLPIESGKPLLDHRNALGIEATTLLTPPPPGLTELRLQGNEGEPPSQRQVDQGQRAVRNVHRTDDVQVRRDKNALAILMSVGELNGLVRPPLGVIEQGQQLAEDLCGVAAIDLLDNEHELPVRLGAGRLNGFEKDAVNQCKPAVFLRSPSSYEILVGQRWVKLNDAHARLGDVPVSRADQRIGKALCKPRLAGAGRPLQNQVLLGAQALQNAFKESLREKATVLDDVFNTVMGVL